MFKKVAMQSLNFLVQSFLCAFFLGANMTIVRSFTSSVLLNLWLLVG
jgi:hypothetical protein